MFFDIVRVVAIFVIALLGLTYISAYLADVTGHFRTLFISTPYRQAFRICRWLLAAALAALALLTIID